MQVLKNVIFIAILLIVTPCFSQKQDKLTVSEKIKYETDRLKEIETKLIVSKEALLRD